MQTTFLLMVFDTPSVLDTHHNLFTHLFPVLACQFWASDSPWSCHPCQSLTCHLPIPPPNLTKDSSFCLSFLSSWDLQRCLLACVLYIRKQKYFNIFPMYLYIVYMIIWDSICYISLTLTLFLFSRFLSDCFCLGLSIYFRCRRLDARLFLQTFR